MARVGAPTKCCGCYSQLASRCPRGIWVPNPRSGIQQLLPHPPHRPSFPGCLRTQLCSHPGGKDSGLRFKVGVCTVDNYCTTQVTPTPPPLLYPWHLPPGSAAPHLPPPPRGGGGALTEMVRVAEVEGVAAVHVVVQGLLDQVLRLIPGQLRHPAGAGGCVSSPALQTAFHFDGTGFAHKRGAKRRGAGGGKVDSRN